MKDISVFLNAPAEGRLVGEDLHGRRGFWVNICTCSCGAIESEN